MRICGQNNCNLSIKGNFFFFLQKPWDYQFRIMYSMLITDYATTSCTAVTTKIYILSVLIPSNPSYVCTKRVFVLTYKLYCVCLYVYFTSMCAVWEILYSFIRTYICDEKHTRSSFYTRTMTTTRRPDLNVCTPKRPIL